MIDAFRSGGDDRGDRRAKHPLGDAKVRRADQADGRCDDDRGAVDVIRRTRCASRLTKYIVGIGTGRRFGQRDAGGVQGVEHAGNVLFVDRLDDTRHGRLHQIRRAEVAVVMHFLDARLRRAQHTRELCQAPGRSGR